MKAVIVGAGEVGFHIADRLSREGHSISMVEKDAEKHRLLKDKVNAKVFHGDGASGRFMEEVGVKDADLFIAVADQDEVNLVSCLVAREFGVPLKIARVKRLEFLEQDAKLNSRTLGIDLLINPESVVADEVFRLASHTAASEVAEFADGRVIFMGLQITAENPVAGVTLRELGDIRGLYRFVVTAITRGEETIIPHGEDLIQEGDTIYFVTNRSDLSSVNYLFGLEKKEMKSIFILGGGRVGYTVARRLGELKSQIKVIDPNPDDCLQIANQLDDVLIINTDGTDIDTLKDEGLSEADVYIAATQDDTTNILCSLLAKQHGVKRVVSLVNQSVLLSLASNLGVDACISPRLATASAILKYVRKGQVLNMAMVEQINAEVTEVIIPARHSIVKKQLKDLHVPAGALIGAIVRGPDVLIPTGDDHLEADDHVIVFALPESVTRVEKFFS